MHDLTGNKFSENSTLKMKNEKKFDLESRLIKFTLRIISVLENQVMTLYTK